MPLAKAREKAAAGRAHASTDGRDPLAEKNAEDRMPTFGELADQHIAAMGPSWRNPKHRAQWEMTLREYAKPLRDKPVNEITTADVLAVLQPIWQTIPETASRVRGRIENVLDAAKVQGFRDRREPCGMARAPQADPAGPPEAHARPPCGRWRSTTCPAFMASLRARPAVAARCLEFAILTAARSGEALGARWDEIDLAAKVWTIPASRMKADARASRAAVRPRALAILTEMRAAYATASTSSPASAAASRCRSWRSKWCCGG